MLFETLSQPKLLLIFVLTGFLCGFIFDLFNFLKFSSKNHKILSFIFDFISSISCFVIYFLINLKYNFGQFRVYTLLIFLIGFTIHRLSIGKILAKTFLWCYNAIVKLTQKLKGLHKDKNASN